LSEPRKHRQFGVKLDTLQAPDAERCEAVVVLQATELALDSGTATVEVAEPLSVARDARHETVRALARRQHRLLSPHAFERDDRVDTARLALGVAAGGTRDFGS
jgi:hypothetical protein